MKVKESGKENTTDKDDTNPPSSAVDAPDSKGEPKEEGKDKPAGEVDKSVNPSVEEGAGSNDNTTDEGKDKPAGEVYVPNPSKKVCR